MFRSVMMYPCSNKEGPFIIQRFHKENWVDWSEMKRGGVDLEGYGVITLQNIDKDMHITLNFR